MRKINPCFNAMMSALQTHLLQSFSDNMSRQALSVKGHEYKFSDIADYVSSYQDALIDTTISTVAVFGDRSLAAYGGQATLTFGKVITDDNIDAHLKTLEQDIYTHFIDCTEVMKEQERR